ERVCELDFAKRRLHVSIYFEIGECLRPAESECMIRRAAADGTKFIENCGRGTVLFLERRQKLKPLRADPSIAISRQQLHSLSVCTRCSAVAAQMSCSSRNEVC